MSKLMENKQLVHIASEVVVLLGLTFYFNQKNKKLMSHIEDLAQRVEEQEDIIQKHEDIIRKLVNFVNSQQIPQTSTNSQHQQAASAFTPAKSKRKRSRQQHAKPPLSTPVGSQASPRVTFGESKTRTFNRQSQMDFSDDEEVEEDLDAELAEELGELEVTDELAELRATNKLGDLLSSDEEMEAGLKKEA